MQALVRRCIAEMSFSYGRKLILFSSVIVLSLSLVVSVEINKYYFLIVPRARARLYVCKPEQVKTQNIKKHRLASDSFKFRCENLI